MDKSKILAPATFEEALADLERIVANLERTPTSLENSLAEFETGVALVRQCRSLLDQAEGRIRELVDLDETGRAKLRPFQHQASASTPPTAGGADEAPVDEPKKTRRKPAPKPLTEHPAEGVAEQPTDDPTLF